MCKAPKMPKPQAAIAPDYVRNPLLDETRGAAGAYFAARIGRSALRIDLGGKARSTGPNAPGTPEAAPQGAAFPPYIAPGTVPGAGGGSRSGPRRLVTR